MTSSSRVRAHHHPLLAWFGGLSLDLRLGLRMLLKYPGLTVVGGLAMAFAIWVGAVIFELIILTTHPALPLPDGDRIVRIENWDAAQSEAEPRALHDFRLWRANLSSITDLGAWREIAPNLRAGNGETREVVGAEISASAFRIDPAPPLMGRVISPADEAAGAPPVVLLGYDVWRTRFDSDPGIIGRSVQVDGAFAMVIGVMPQGFAFPVSHELWTPLRTGLLDQTPGQGPAISIFGRLAPGITLAAAQSELTLLGRRISAAFPVGHEHLQPRLAPYTELFYVPTGTNREILLSINLFAIMLLVLVCGNVALLMFARAASRENELVVRSALGASRGRIVTQFFAEALVLGGLSSAVGLAAAQFGLVHWGKPFMELNMGRLPFWYDIHLSTATICYAIGLTLLGAAVAGVIPALKATRGLGTRLRAGTTGGGGLRFGGVWTAVIISQVAVTVAFPAVAYVQQRELRRIRSYDVGFAAGQYLGARLEMDAAEGSGPDSAAVRAAGQRRFSAALETLRSRLASEPGVTGATYVDQLPRLFHRERRIELDNATPGAGQGPEVSLASVEAGYFDVLNSPIIAGRGFHSGDVAGGSRTVIVDQGFVDQVLQGRNPLGTRLRFELRTDDPADALRPWYTVVGVVKDLGMTYMTHQHRAAGVYFPLDLSSAGPLYLMIHAGADPLALATRVRALVAEVDPTLHLTSVTRVDRVTDSIQWILGLWIRITVVLIAVALLLSLAGIYAVLSFTVAQRTREIGVRVALGASRQRVVTAIFRRPLTQVTLGVVAGGLIIGTIAIARASLGDDANGAFSAAQVALLVGYAGFMLGVCLIACAVPAWRALKVEPMEALRSE